VRRLPHIAQLSRERRKVRVEQRTDDARLRHKLTQEFEPLGFEIRGQDAYAGGVPARPVEACGKTHRNGIAADNKRNGNG